MQTLWSGPGCLLLGLVLLAAPWCLVAGKRATERWLVRALEERSFAAVRRRNYIAMDSHHRVVVFPIATILTCFVAAAVVRAFVATNDYKALERVLLFLTVTVIVAAVIFVIIAFCLHTVQRWRALKYDLILTAVILPSLAYSSLIASSIAGIMPVYAIASVVVFIAAQVALYVMIVLIFTMPQTARAYQVIQSPPVLLLAVMFCPPMVILVIIARFHVVYRMAQRPIIYMRAFGNRDSPRIFSEIIAVAARPVGVVEGLVHPSERASALQGSMDMTQQAHFSLSRDDQWKAWVEERLRRASASSSTFPSIPRALRGKFSRPFASPEVRASRY